MSNHEYSHTTDSITHVESGRSLRYEQTVSVLSGGHHRGQDGWSVVGIPGGKYGEVLLQKGGSQWKVPMLNCHPTSPAPGSQDALDAAKGQHPASSTPASSNPAAPEAPTQEQAAAAARILGAWTKTASWEELAAALGEMNKAMCEVWGTASSVVQVGVFKKNGKSGFCMRAPYEAPQPVTYPAGSRVGVIKDFDRSQHLTFRCASHPEAQYLSKDPYVSAWAPVGLDRAICPPSCELPLNDYEIVLDYVVKPRQ